MSDAPVREFGGWQATENSVSDQKICQNPQNGLSQKWSQIGRNYLYGRDTATFRFWGGWNVRFEDLEAETCDPTQRAQTSVFGPKNLSRTSKWHISKMVSDWF